MARRNRESRYCTSGARDWRYLFVGTNTAEVLRIALDGTTEAESGEVDWRTSAYGAITRITSGHGLSSSVLVGTAGGEVHSLYDGRGLWRTKVPGKVTALTAQQGNDIYVATFGGGVLHLRTAAHAGRVAWRAEDGPVAQGSLVQAGGALFGTDGAGLTKLDMRKGGIAWTLGDSFSTPAGAVDTIYVGGQNQVAAYALSGGVGLEETRMRARRWSYSFQNGWTPGVTVADGEVFVPIDGQQGSKSALLALE